MCYTVFRKETDDMQNKKKNGQCGRPSKSDPERARTSGLQFRKLSLYPLSYGIMNWLAGLIYESDLDFGFS